MKIKAKIKINKKESKIYLLEDESYLIFIKSKPIKGAANKEVINLLANHFQVTKKEIEIVSGKTSTNKTIEIRID